MPQDNSQYLFKAGFAGKAEQLRQGSFFWALKYEELTGIEEVPKIPRYRSVN